MARLVGKAERDRFPQSLNALPVLLPTGHSALRPKLDHWFATQGLRPRIVGEFEGKGGYQSEIWGDLNRISEALQRPVRSRVIAKVQPGTDLAAIQTRYESDLRLQPAVQTERAYLASQTKRLSLPFQVLGGFLA